MAVVEVQPLTPPAVNEPGKRCCCRIRLTSFFSSFHSTHMRMSKSISSGNKDRNSSQFIINYNTAVHIAPIHYIIATTISFHSSALAQEQKITRYNAEPRAVRGRRRSNRPESCKCRYLRVACGSGLMRISSRDDGLLLDGVMRLIEY